MDSDDSGNEGLVIDEVEYSREPIYAKRPTENGKNAQNDDAARASDAVTSTTTTNEPANGHDDDAAYHSEPSTHVDKHVNKQRRLSQVENGRSHSNEVQQDDETPTSTAAKIQQRRESVQMPSTSTGTTDANRIKTKPAAGKETPRRHSEHRDKSQKGKSKNHRSKGNDSKRKHTPKKYEITEGNRKIQASRLIGVNPTEEKQIKILMPKHQFYNMKLYRTDDALLVNFPVYYPAPPPVPEIRFEHLLEWPGVSITVALDFTTIRHVIKPNITRQIVCGDDPLFELPVEQNVMEPRYVSSSAPTSRRNPLVSRQAILAYLPASLKAGSIYDIQASKLNELKTSLDIVNRDLEAMPYDELEMRSIHSKYPNKYKYFRYFANEKPTGKNVQAACIREIINPEMNFSIEKCMFTLDNVDVWMEQMNEVMHDMFVRRTKRFGDELRERFKKAITLRCEMCYVSFDGALGSVALIAHMKEKHYYAKNWSCTNCKQSWSHIELLSMKWKHECDSVNSTNAEIR